MTWQMRTMQSKNPSNVEGQTNLETLIQTISKFEEIVIAVNPELNEFIIVGSNDGKSREQARQIADLFNMLEQVKPLVDSHRLSEKPQDEPENVDNSQDEQQATQA